MPLAEAGPEIRMVESLQSMWDEEKLRIGGSPPPPPPEPTRTAKPLCQHIEVVRAQLQVCLAQSWPTPNSILSPYWKPVVKTISSSDIPL